MKMKIVLTLGLFLSVFTFADTDSDIRDLKLEKEKLNSEIQKLNKQISATDSMLRADEVRYKMLSERYKADVERRKSEIDSLNAKIRNVASQIQNERNKQASAKNRSEDVKAKRKALRESLLLLCKRFEKQISETLPWELETRLDRAKSLTRDLESGNATEEEGFSRLKSLIAEETKFGDEVVVVNSPITRKNGELVNAQVLRIGNQWMVYCDDNATIYGSLIRKNTFVNCGDSSKCESITYEWNENLSLSERNAVKFAIDVKLAKKPPQIVKLPVSLSIVKDGGEK